MTQSGVPNCAIVLVTIIEADLHSNMMILKTTSTPTNVTTLPKQLKIQLCL